MNKLGFKLENLFLNGADKHYSGPIRDSDKNSCLGRLDYETGTNYVFAVSGLTDCGTRSTTNSTHIVIENAIQGEAGRTNGVITRKLRTWVDFSCAYAKEVQVSTAVGHVQTKQISIDLGNQMVELNMNMALYETNDFTAIITESKNYAVPEPVYVQAEATNLPGGFVMSLDTCWATPDSNIDNEISYTMVENGGCPTETDDSIVVLQSGTGQKGQFLFDSFTFLSNTEASIYLHCRVRVCDPANEICTPQCNARKR